MRVVVDIPNWLYNAIMKCEEPEYSKSLGYAVRDGITLPKGHGRLIDADRVIKEATELMKYPTNYKYMECVIAHMHLASTIVKADEED